MGNAVLSVATFADDILCLSIQSKEGIERQLEIIMRWCKRWNMRLSESKTYISTLSEENNWRCENHEGSTMEFQESMMFSYLGLDFHIKGRDFLMDQYKRMLSKAEKYRHAILNTTRESLDRSLVAHSLWESCAVPAIMYGAEACILSEKTLKNLDEKQRSIAAFITGLSIKGGNTALTVESGLMPFKARYHIAMHRFFNRLLKSRSHLIGQALVEHQEGGWSSPYKRRIDEIIKLYGLEYMTPKVAIRSIKEEAWAQVMKEVYSLKSLRYFSSRVEPWMLPGHITDSQGSAVLSRFRTGNAGLGNRAPLQNRDRMKDCPLCKEKSRKRRLNEEHIVLQCPELRSVHRHLGFETFWMKYGRNSLYKYLGGDKCTDEELLRRGSKLDDLLSQYLERVA